MKNLFGIRMDERNGRYRVIREFSNGKHAVLGIYCCLSQALDAATAHVLQLDPEGSEVN